MNRVLFVLFNAKISLTSKLFSSSQNKTSKDVSQVRVLIICAIVPGFLSWIKFHVVKSFNKKLIHISQRTKEPSKNFRNRKMHDQQLQIRIY